MLKKPSMKEIAYEFRATLTSDFAVAESFLQNRPELIDHPVFGDSESAIHFFATENHGGIVTWLIDHNACPNGISDDDSPLHAASQLGHLGIYRLPLKAGADPNCKESLSSLHVLFPERRIPSEGQGRPSDGDNRSDQF